MDIGHEERGHRGAFVIERDGKRLAELTYTVAGSRVILDHAKIGVRARFSRLGSDPDF